MKKIVKKTLFFFFHKKILFLVSILSIIIYFFLCFIYRQFMLDSISVFVLNKDISKGQIITVQDVQRIFIKNYPKDEIVDLSECRAKYNLKKGQILKNNIITNKSDDGYKEKVIIPMEKKITGLKKGDFINVYITTETKNLKNQVQVNNFFTNTNLHDSLLTIRLIEMCPIIDLYYDKEEKGYLIVEVEKEVALKLENMKYYSKFSISISVKGE